MISAIINTHNEQDNITRSINSIKGWVNQIIVVDMESTDDTVSIAEKLGAQVYHHKHVGYVEPARNFAISKAKHDWILIIDADEEISSQLRETLTLQIGQDKYDYFKIPRKNIIFNKWIDAAGWWPDYNIRCFRKGHVTWSDQIHSQPQVTGQGFELPAREELAILHHHYQTISQYLNRLNRYTDYQLLTLKQQDYQFQWTDLIAKPTNEFLSRYFALHGYRLGLHGLVLSFLQAISELILYLKAWEQTEFQPHEIDFRTLQSQINNSARQVYWWLAKLKKEHHQVIPSIIDQIKSKLL